MKKFINIFIAFILVIALTACRQTEVSSSQQNSADQAQVSREMSKISDEEILQAAKKINDAMYIYTIYISGSCSDPQKSLPAEKSPFPGRTYYEMTDEFSTLSSLQDFLSGYFSQKVIDEYFLAEINSSADFPLILDIDGKLYHSLGKDLGNVYFFETDTAKVTEHADAAATVEIYKHHPNDASIRYKCSFKMVKESDRWIYDEKLW